MDEKQLLQAIGQMIDEKLEPINTQVGKIAKDVTTLKDDVSEIKEDTAATR